MLYKKIENPEGKYINKNGQRFDLLECKEAFGPQATSFGTFADLSDAVDGLALEEV